MAHEIRLRIGKIVTAPRTDRPMDPWHLVQRIRQPEFVARCRQTLGLRSVPGRKHRSDEVWKFCAAGNRAQRLKWRRGGNCSTHVLLRQNKTLTDFLHDSME